MKLVPMLLLPAVVGLGGDPTTPDCTESQAADIRIHYAGQDFTLETEDLGSGPQLVAQLEGAKVSETCVQIFGMGPGGAPLFPPVVDACPTYENGFEAVIENGITPECDCAVLEESSLWTQASNPSGVAGVPTPPVLPPQAPSAGPGGPATGSGPSGQAITLVPGLVPGIDWQPPAYKAIVRCMGSDPDPLDGRRVAGVFEVWTDDDTDLASFIPPVQAIIAKRMAGQQPRIPETIQLVALVSVRIENHCESDERITIVTETPSGFAELSWETLEDDGSPFRLDVEPETVVDPDGWTVTSWVLDSPGVDDAHLDPGEVLSLTQRTLAPFTSAVTVSFDF